MKRNKNKNKITYLITLLLLTRQEKKEPNRNQDGKKKIIIIYKLHVNRDEKKKQTNE